MSLNKFKGLPPSTPPTTSASASATANGEANDARIVIGLFGNDAPQPVSVLKQLVTKDGYKEAKCKPLDAGRTLIKEQLEANKVYNTCMETEDTVGVNYDYATVWRIIKNEASGSPRLLWRRRRRLQRTWRWKECRWNGVVHDFVAFVKNTPT